MRKIYDNLNEILPYFHCIVFDAFGVFWDGDNFYPRILDLMKSLVSQGKNVYVLSNTIQLDAENIRRYKKFGMLKGVHYNELITAGEAARDFLRSKKLKFKKNKNPATYYSLFDPYKKIFQGSGLKMVKKPEMADFFFVSTPTVNDSEKEVIKKYRKYLELMKMREIENDEVDYDSRIIDPYLPALQQMLDLGLPAFSANPDKYTPAGFVRPGLLMEKYREMGGETVEVGKPSKAIYEFALKKIKCPRDRILMIGDTIYTDIKGANNYGIKSALLLEQGITGRDVFDGKKIDVKKLDRLLKENGAEADFLVKKVA